MVTHYRWDFIGLSTDTKPTPATSEKVTDGSTFYCSDNSKLYVWYKTQWYEKTATGGGGEPYVLPIASSETLGGVKVGSNLSINAETGELSATDTTYSAFTGTDGETAGASGLVPAPATTDAGKFLKADGTWDTAGGGSGPTVVQTTGTSTTDVMSQDSTTSMVFADPAYLNQVKIGSGSSIGSVVGHAVAIKGSVGSSAEHGVAIDGSVGSQGDYSTAIRGSVGPDAKYSVAIGGSVTKGDSVAIGRNSYANTIGQFDIGAGGSTGTGTTGYNSSAYRLLTGLYDPQSAHDAATKSYVDSATINGGTTLPTTATVGAIGTLYSCVNSGTPEIYMCTDDTNSTYTWTKVV